MAESSGGPLLDWSRSMNLDESLRADTYFTNKVIHF